MKKFKNFTLNEYLDCLSKKTPTPGGGSAAALSGSLGVSLLLMVLQYSKGKSKSKRIEQKFRNLESQLKKSKKRLIELIDLDAQCYLEVVRAKNKSITEKRKTQRKAQKVPLEVCQLSFKSIDRASFIAEKGSRYLIADVAIAVELLFAAFNSGLALIDEAQ